MANVNTSQIRTILHTARPGDLVLIHASVLLSIMSQYKTDHGGSEVVLSTVTVPATRAPLDLTGF